MVDLISGKVVDILVKKAAEQLFRGSTSMSSSPVDEDSLPDRLRHHLREVCGWSEHLDVVDAREPRDVETNTLAIKLDVPRRLRSADRSSTVKHEELDLLRTYLFSGNLST